MSSWETSMGLALARSPSYSSEVERVVPRRAPSGQGRLWILLPMSRDDRCGLLSRSSLQVSRLCWLVPGQEPPRPRPGDRLGRDDLLLVGRDRPGWAWWGSPVLGHQRAQAERVSCIPPGPLPPPDRGALMRLNPPSPSRTKIDWTKLMPTAGTLEQSLMAEQLLISASSHGLSSPVV